MSAVVERAGVRRSTLYRHFPDESALFDACSAHWAAANPVPDLGAWTAIEAGDTLMDGRRTRGRARRRVQAAIGHALAFTTWRSVVREQGLDDSQAAELMCRLVAAANSRRPPDS